MNYVIYMKKHCKDCNKPERHSGSSYCKECYLERRRLRRNELTPEQKLKLAAQQKQWALSNKDKVREYSRLHTRKSIAHRRFKKYGVTQEEYTSMYESQNGRCLICNEKNDLVIDHCHTTNKVRGLLCNACNKAIGFFRDDPIRCISASKYLTE